MNLRNRDQIVARSHFRFDIGFSLLVLVDDDDRGVVVAQQRREQ